jgi:hypothetical protein
MDLETSHLRAIGDMRMKWVIIAHPKDVLIAPELADTG